MRLPRRVQSFLAVSGAGWLLDIMLFASLTGALGVRPLLANLVSTTTAVAFVFHATHERIFDGTRERRLRHFAYYLVYQALLLTAVSFALVVLLDATGLLPVVGKILITPVTVVANYLALGIIASSGAERTAAPQAPQAERAGGHW